MKIEIRWMVLGVLAALALAIAPVATSAGEQGQIVTFGAGGVSNFITGTLDGTVTSSLSTDGLAPADFAPSSNGSIAFTAGGDHSGSIWLLHADGQAVELDSAKNDFAPSITSDGSKVTFGRYDTTTGASDIYVVNADGSGLTLVAGGERNDYLSSPRFSPDGGSIAYACAPAIQALGTGLGCGPTVEGTYHAGGVMLMNADGTDKRLILLGAGDDAQPIGSLSWSPDGQWLTFSGCVNVVVGTSVTCGPEQIYAYRTDGSDLFNNLDSSRQVTHETGTFGAFLPQFCGDSSQILYRLSVDDSGGQGNFSYLIGRDGSNRHEIFLSPDGQPWGQCVPPSTGGGPHPTVDVVPPGTGAGQLVIPSWSAGWLPQCVGFVVEGPSGAFNRCEAVPPATAPVEYGVAADGSVAFTDASKGSGDGGPIWVVHPNGSAHELDSSADDEYPSIAPDGSKVVFARFDPSTGTSGIYIAASDGSGLRLLASGGGNSGGPNYPELSPDGGSIAYTDGPNEMLMKADGSDKRTIVQLQGGPASWSPDGQWLAMAECIPKVVGKTVIPCDNQQVFAYRTDGSDLYNRLDLSRQITHLAPLVGPFNPRFSPDGSKVLFMRGIDDNGKQGDFAYLVNRDGSDQHQISLLLDPPVCQAAGGCFPQPTAGQFIPTVGGGGPSATVRPTHATVPEVRTLGINAAKARLATVHLSAKVIRRSYSSRIRRGHVIAQYPHARAHARLAKKQRPVVRLILSRGRRS